MAKSVKEIPYISEYPWGEWLKVGSKWKLTQEEDFKVSLKSMSCQIHTAAKRMNVSVKIRTIPAEKVLFMEVVPAGKGRQRLQPVEKAPPVSKEKSPKGASKLPSPEKKKVKPKKAKAPKKKASKKEVATNG